MYYSWLNTSIFGNRKIAYLIVAVVLLCAGCAASKDPQRKEIKQLQKGILKEDTSYVYRLPYEDRPYLVVQGYFSKYSHKNRAALDFKMKKGTKVLAARDGVVIRVKKDSKKGGWSKKYRSYANLIVIQHSDSSRAGYWHLQYNGALVNVGDTVKQGQLIGLSGRTGYALFPHLHFIAWRSNMGGGWTQIGTRFQTSKGIRYLRPFRFYRHFDQNK
jgi:murein DD-endopeptidase MepM/ murein hydrolase activator NlpD